MNVGLFFDKYSTDNQCLEIVKKLKYPKGVFCKFCNKVSRFYKVDGRPLYECSCGYQVSPLVGTPFENSHISLQDWFYAIFCMSTTRSGVSAAQLQRQLKVNYKTAWRILHKIRKAMGSDGKSLLTGVVEADETYIGWRRNYRYQTFDGRNDQVVLGMIERGGESRLRHIPDNSRYNLWKQILHNVDRDARLMTDHLPAYIGISRYGYRHQYVTHQREFVRGDVYTQTIETEWGMLKRSLSGVYHKVSKKYLQNYLNEYEWRHNHRRHGEKMFELLLKQMVGTHDYTIPF